MGKISMNNSLGLTSQEDLPETTNGTRPFRHADHEREWTREEFLFQFKMFKNGMFILFLV